MKKSVVKKFARQFRNSLEIGLLLFLFVVCILKRNLMSEVFTTDVIISGLCILCIVIVFNAGRLSEFLWPTLKKRKISDFKNDMVQPNESIPAQTMDVSYTPPANPKRYFQDMPLENESDEENEEDIDFQDVHSENLMPEEP